MLALEKSTKLRVIFGPQHTSLKPAGFQWLGSWFLADSQTVQQAPPKLSGVEFQHGAHTLSLHHCSDFLVSVLFCIPISISVSFLFCTCIHSSVF